MRKCREKISWKHRGIFKMSLKIFPIFLIFLVLLILPILFYRLSLVQDPRALTECEAFLKDNAEFVEHTARASCMDAGKLFFVLYFVPYDVHMAEIRNGKLESHVAFSCKVDSCKNEDVPWDTFKQKYTTCCAICIGTVPRAVFQDPVESEVLLPSRTIPFCMFTGRVLARESFFVISGRENSEKSLISFM